jgi:hypothetical protein
MVSRLGMKYEGAQRTIVEEPLCCCLIDICHCELGEQLVRLFFFVESLPQKLAGILHAELIGSRDERAITGDLVMLDSLRRSKHACVMHVPVFDFLHDILGFPPKFRPSPRSVWRGRSHRNARKPPPAVQFDARSRRGFSKACLSFADSALFASFGRFL